MIISRKRNISPLSVKIEGTALEQCKTYKYLGVIIDENLNWKSHIEYICGKISRAVGGLATLRHCTNIEILREVYFALINSYVRYGITAWGNASESTLQPLNVLINKAVRIMTFAPYGPLDIKPIYKELEFLDIHQTFLLEMGKFMYKKKKNLLPVNIANHFELESAVQHRYNLRNRQNITPKFNNKSATGAKSFQIEGEKLWNVLPPYLKSCDSLNIFKKLYKSHLLD